MASSPLYATPSEPTALDRLQQAVGGWVGPAVYTLPILEVWLLSRMGETGATAMLVALQVGWALSFVVLVMICGRRWRAPAVAHPVATGAEDTSPECATASSSQTRSLGLSSGARRTTTRRSPRQRGDHH